MQGEVTIGQAAAFAGVTIKTVRHYHRLGVLAEPARDSSGYRRYGSKELTRLVQIRTLADAGVPLVQVGDLLEADPDEFLRVLAELDVDLGSRIHSLGLRRSTLRLLGEGDRALLPTEAMELLKTLSRLEFDDTFIAAYREGLILARASEPERFGLYVDHFTARMNDAEHVRLLKQGIEAQAWSHDDPRLPQLADAIAANLVTLASKPPTDLRRADLVATHALVSNHRAEEWPMSSRLTRLVEDRLRN